MFDFLLNYSRRFLEVKLKLTCLLLLLTNLTVQDENDIKKTYPIIVPVMENSGLNMSFKLNYSNPDHREIFSMNCFNAINARRTNQLEYDSKVSFWFDIDPLKIKHIQH